MTAPLRFAIGRAGFLATPGGARLRELRPSWDLREGTGAAWPALLRDADVAIPIIAPVTTPLLAETRLRLIQQFGVGVDPIDLAAARAAGVPVSNLPGALTGNADAVAEVAVAFTLTLVRRLDAAREGARAGADLVIAPSLLGRRVLLVGLGDVGRAIALRLAPFGVHLTGVRADVCKGAPAGVSAVVAPAGLRSALAEADVVILCLPARPDADPLLCEAEFRAMRAGAALVNVARGSLVDERALLAALDAGHLAGAALDVLVHDPALPTDPLVTHPRVLVTPHIAGVTVDMLRRSAELVVENVERVLAGGAPHWRLA